jgi:hypothetical protein
MVVGIGLFGTFTGFVANAFLSPKTSEEPSVREVGPEPTSAGPSPDVRARIEEIRVLLETRERTSAELLVNLALLEGSG